MQAESHDHLYKVLLLGQTQTGKSCILLRYTDNNFTDMYITTIGIDFKIKSLEHDGSVAKLQMWDTAGQERFQTITRSYYNGAHAFIIVYDVTNRQSFDRLNDFLKGVNEYGGQKSAKVIVGNKCEQEGSRKVGQEEAKAFAAEVGAAYVEVSAKENIGIDQLFYQVVSEIKLKTNL